MFYPECCHDKLSQYKIGGPSKPFIDKNLQLQLPGWDLQQHNNHSHSPIYSHYIGSSPSSYLSIQVNEAEIHQAIAEAKNSYYSWKQMRDKLKKAANAYFKAE